MSDREIRYSYHPVLSAEIQKLIMGSYEQKIREEILSMFEEYDTLPQLIKEELPFNSFMNHHPKLCYKTEFAKKKNHMIALTLFAQEEERKTSSEEFENVDDDFSDMNAPTIDEFVIQEEEKSVVEVVHDEFLNVSYGPSDGVEYIHVLLEEEQMKIEEDTVIEIIEPSMID